MNNKVSIVVPIYNVEKYVRKCLESLVNQTYNNIEIWAISDGSPDNSGKIVNEFSKVDSRVKYIEKENGGYGSVLSYAIKNIETKYMIICDPDDWMAENAIESLVNAAEKNDLDIVVGDKFLAYNDGEIVYSKCENEFYELIPNKVYTENVTKFSFLPPSPHSKLYRTEILKNIIFPNKVSFTDFILYCIALKNSNRVMYINEALSYYLLDRPGNTRTDRRPKAVMDHIVVWNSIFDQIDEKDSYLIYRLYKELKYITKVYYKNSINIYKDDIFSEIKKCVLRIKPFKKKIKNNFTTNFISKVELSFLLGNNFKLKLFISLRRMIKR